MRVRFNPNSLLEPQSARQGANLAAEICSAAAGGMRLLRPCTSRFLQPDKDIPAAICALHVVMLLVIAASSLVRMWRKYLLSGVPLCKYQIEMALQGRNILGVEGTCFISDGSSRSYKE